MGTAADSENAGEKEDRDRHAAGTGCGKACDRRTVAARISPATLQAIATVGKFGAVCAITPLRQGGRGGRSFAWGRAGKPERPRPGGRGGWPRLGSGGKPPPSPRRSHGLGSARLGSARLGSARLGSARLGSARLGSARLGSARLGSARLGSARLGSARLGSARLGSARLLIISFVASSGTNPFKNIVLSLHDCRRGGRRAGPEPCKRCRVAATEAAEPLGLDEGAKNARAGGPRSGSGRSTPGGHSRPNGRVLQSRGTKPPANRTVT